MADSKKDPNRPLPFDGGDSVCIPPEGDQFVPNGPFGTMWYDSGSGPVKIDPPAGDPSTWDGTLKIGPQGPYWAPNS